MRKISESEKKLKTILVGLNISKHITYSSYTPTWIKMPSAPRAPYFLVCKRHYDYESKTWRIVDVVREEKKFEIADKENKFELCEKDKKLFKRYPKRFMNDIINLLDD